MKELCKLKDLWQELNTLHLLHLRKIVKFQFVENLVIYKVVVG